MEDSRLGALSRYKSVCQVAREISRLGDDEQQRAGQQQGEGQMTSVSDSFVGEKTFSFY